MYQREGFQHLLGGLEGGTRGYNREDLGEWLMVRKLGQLPALEEHFTSNSEEPTEDRTVPIMAGFYGKLAFWVWLGWSWEN